MTQTINAPVLDSSLEDCLLRCRPPQSKEELYWYVREHLRVECETCKGSGHYWELGATRTCPACDGEGSHGFYLARTAVCPNHRPLLDVVWEVWSGLVRHQLWLANRSGGKTRALAVVEHLFARFHRFTISHMGAIEQQAKRVRAYLQQQTNWGKGGPGQGGSPAVPPFGYDARSKEPAPPGLPTHWETGEPIAWVPELAQDSTENVTWANGAAIEFLPGTMAQAAGPHRELSVLDEVDEAKPEVQQKFAQTAYGHRARFIQASTYSYATGTVSKILREQPHIPVSRWCLWESLARCEYDCDQAPLPDGTLGRCPLFEERTIGQDGRLEVRPLCGGELARRSDGHIPVAVAIAKRLDSDPYTFGVEWLLREPDMGMGTGRAYWAYAPENDLSFDPPIRIDVPLEWTLDFNPSHAKEMCSLVLQQAPPAYPNEWWAVDEIVLPASNTPMVLREFTRRYGPNGDMLPPEHDRDRPFRAGVWVTGDRGGHSPTSAIGQTDYQVIVAALRAWPDFRLLVMPEEANPPLVDRLNRANDLLWDSITGKRTLRLAPRVKRFREELARQPLQPGTRQKDKSERFQRLGLTHLGDAFEYWAWKRFPYGVRTVAGFEVPVLSKARRESAGLAPRAGSRRIAAGGSGLPTPWSIGRRGSFEEE